LYSFWGSQSQSDWPATRIVHQKAATPDFDTLI
jgi:hypothetical protein